MKFATLLFFILFTEAFASNCTPEVEALFLEWDPPIQAFKVSEDHDNLSELEKRMVHETIRLTDWHPEITLEEALDLFADRNERTRTPGALAGNISYYEMNGKIIVDVTYYPGDNHYGAIYELKGEVFTLLTEIYDSYLGCQTE